MPRSMTVRESVLEYLRGDITAQQLNDQLPDVWDLEGSGEQLEADRALRVVGYLAGFQAGDRNESDLRESLEALIGQTIVVEYLSPPDDLMTVLATNAAQFVTKSAGGDSSLAAGFELSAS